MKPAQLLTITFVLLILFSVIIRYHAFRTGSILMFISTLYLCLYYLIRTIEDIKNKSGNIFLIAFQIIIILISIVIFAKYSYFNFGYFIGIAVIPLFLVTTIVYWIKTKKETIELTIASFVFFFLCIPMFDIFYGKDLFDKDFKAFYPQQFIKYYETGTDYYNLYSFWNIDRNYEPSEEISELSRKAHILAVEEERYEEAIAIYQQIIASIPPNAFMHYRLAKCYYHIKQYDFALPALNLAIKLDPVNAKYYNFRGFMYSELDSAELALINIKKSLKLDPKDASTYINLAAVYYYLYKDTLKAYEAIEKAKLYDAELANEFLPIIQEMKEKPTQE